jgi:cytochrome c peroxidase
LKRLKVILLHIPVVTILISGCQKEPITSSQEGKILAIPPGFPEIDFPEGNEFTPERWAFGKKLFYDPALSLNNSVSCASCHKPELAFSDDVSLSLGDGNQTGKSNSPTLANIAYHPYFTRAGGVPTLEMQILVPIQEHDEFNFNIVDLAERLKQIPEYAEAALNCYNRELDPYVITRAIANFERTLISGNSSFDKYFYQGRQNALNEAEKRGMELFFSSKTDCSGCHNNFNFSNYAFENNGLYEQYADSGRMRLTHLEEDRARFKVPTLRNVSKTGPYMHDGSIETLEEVVNHYNSGGYPHVNKSELIRPLNLTLEERADLVAFLNSLTDYEFIFNQNLR